MKHWNKFLISNSPGILNYSVSTKHYLWRNEEMGVKNYFYQYKPLNVSGKKKINTKVTILVMCLKINEERTEWRQKSRQRKNKEQYYKKKQ